LSFCDLHEKTSTVNVINALVTHLPLSGSIIVEDSVAYHCLMIKLVGHSRSSSNRETMQLITIAVSVLSCLIASVILKHTR